MKKFLGTLLFLVSSTFSFSQTYIAMVKSNGAWGYVNLKGEFIVKPTLKSCEPFSAEGLALVETPRGERAFVRPDGQMLMPEIRGARSLREFNSGMAAIRPTKLWGFINTDGALAIEAKYDDVTDFDGGFATAQIGNRHMILDKQGREILIEDDDVKGLKRFSEGLAPYHNNDGLFGFIATDGSVAVSPQFKSVGYFTNGLAWTKTEMGIVGFIDKTGKWAIQPTFDAVQDFDDKDGPARVKKNGVWGYVSRSGEIIYVKDTDVWGDFHEPKGKKAIRMAFTM